MDYPIIRDFENHSLFGMSREASIMYALVHGWELEIMIGDNYNVGKSCYTNGAHHSFVVPKTWQVSVPLRVVRGHASCPCGDLGDSVFGQSKRKYTPRRI